jgi:NAD(P)-dependent dehydrogenase (short-subunit alcohol dehydrogenase family)
MTAKFEGKVAVVTGGGSGIGRAATLRFVRDGARVVVADYNEAAARETAAMAGSDRCAVVRADVALEADNAATARAAIANFGRLDFAFLNAGVGGAFGPIADTTVEEWDYTFAVLVRGVFLGIKHCSTAMRRNGDAGGAIVSTASVAGLQGGAGSHAYSAAKAAVINLTKNVAVELAQHRIRVNAVAPGTISTPLLHRGKPEKYAEVLSRQPWPDTGAPEHLADVVAFLCSHDARFVTGETIAVDGGLIARGLALWGSGADNVMTKRAGVDRGSTGEPVSVRDATTR